MWKSKKGFTLVELIVVISIIGILTLLATPKLIGHTKEAKLAQIKNDVKAVEAVIDEYLIRNKALPEGLSVFDYSKSLEENKVYDKNGLVSSLTGEFLDITDMPEVKKVNSQLKGYFIANNSGDVYYVETDTINIVTEDDIKKPDEVTEEMSSANIPKEWLSPNYPKIDISGYGAFVRDENSVYTFGGNFYGQLGVGDTTNRFIPTKIDALSNKNIVKIIGNTYNHTYAVSKNGDVYVFGDNKHGQLGLGHIIQQNTPIINDIISNFSNKDIRSRGDHSLLLENGKVYAWGRNLEGQLGLGDTINRTTPTEITFFSTNNIEVKDVFAGQCHSFATTTDNKLYVWGRNNSGELGLGNNINQLTPVELIFFSGVPIKDIKTNASSTFVLTEDGKLYSFGYNAKGELGLGDTTTRTTPQLVNVGGKVVDEIITGWVSTIVKATDGTVYGWGYNQYGELSVSGSKTSPVRLTAIEQLNPIDIQMGTYHTIVSSNNGDFYVLGLNMFGAFGLGISPNNTIVPQKMSLSYLND